MKAKFYIGIFSALLLTALPVKAQFADNRDYRNDGAGIVINNYYDDYDYYFSSRINRFHRSYAAFEYYSPVFTDTYWYNYQPYSWGLSIYGRSGFGYGYSVNYPVYYNAWDYNRGYDPYYGSSYYWGYDPFYYSWYSPVIININLGSRWRNNYWGWNSHNHWYNDYRPVYNTYNHNDNYHSTRYSSREYYNDNRSSGYNRSSSGTARRESKGVPSSGTDVNRNNERIQSDNNTGQERRSAEVRNTGTYNRNTGNRSNTGNNGNNSNNGNNNNSRTDGNNGNFGQNTNNSGNNGNNRSSRTDGNNGNFGQNDSNIGNSGNNRNSNADGNKGNISTNRSTVTRPPAPANVPSRSDVTTRPASSSSRSGGTRVSQGRSSSSGSAAKSSGPSKSSGSRSETSSSSSNKKDRSRR